MLRLVYVNRERIAIYICLPYHLSNRHRNKELSTDAQARRISGNTPQKATVWHALYRSVTIAGISLTMGVSILAWVGHCRKK